MSSSTSSATNSQMLTDRATLQSPDSTNLDIMTLFQDRIRRSALDSTEREQALKSTFSSAGKFLMTYFRQMFLLFIDSVIKRNQLSAEISALKNDLTISTGIRTSLETERTHLTDGISQLSLECDAANQKITKLQAELSNLQNDNKRMTLDIIKMDSDVRDLEKENQDLKNQPNLKSANDLLTTENQALKDEIERLTICSVPIDTHEFTLHQLDNSSKEIAHLVEQNRKHVEHSLLINKSVAAQYAAHVQCIDHMNVNFYSNFPELYRPITPNPSRPRTTVPTTIIAAEAIALLAPPNSPAVSIPPVLSSDISTPSETAADRVAALANALVSELDLDSIPAEEEEEEEEEYGDFSHSTPSVDDIYGETGIDEVDNVPTEVQSTISTSTLDDVDGSRVSSNLNILSYPSNDDDEFPSPLNPLSSLNEEASPSTLIPDTSAAPTNPPSSSPVPIPQITNLQEAMANLRNKKNIRIVSFQEEDDPENENMPIHRPESYDHEEQFEGPYESPRDRQLTKASLSLPNIVIPENSPPPHSDPIDDDDFVLVSRNKSKNAQKSKSHTSKSSNSKAIAIPTDTLVHPPVIKKTYSKVVKDSDSTPQSVSPPEPFIDTGIRSDLMTGIFDTIAPWEVLDDPQIQLTLAYTDPLLFTLPSVRSCPSIFALLQEQSEMSDFNTGAGFTANDANQLFSFLNQTTNSTIMAELFNDYSSWNSAGAASLLGLDDIPAYTTMIQIYGEAKTVALYVASRFFFSFIFYDRTLRRVATLGNPENLTFVELAMDNIGNVYSICSDSRPSYSSFVPSYANVSSCVKNDPQPSTSGPPISSVSHHPLTPLPELDSSIVDFSLSRPTPTFGDHLPVDNRYATQLAARNIAFANPSKKVSVVRTPTTNLTYASHFEELMDNPVVCHHGDSLSMDWTASPGILTLTISDFHSALPSLGKCLHISSFAGLAMKICFHSISPTTIAQIQIIISPLASMALFGRAALTVCNIGNSVNYESYENVDYLQLPSSAQGQNPLQIVEEYIAKFAAIKESEVIDFRSTWSKRSQGAAHPHAMLCLLSPKSREHLVKRNHTKPRMRFSAGSKTSYLLQNGMILDKTEFAIGSPLAFALISTGYQYFETPLHLPKTCVCNYVYPNHDIAMNCSSFHCTKVRPEITALIKKFAPYTKVNFESVYVLDKAEATTNTFPCGQILHFLTNADLSKNHQAIAVIAPSPTYMAYGNKEIFTLLCRTAPSPGYKLRPTYNYRAHSDGINLVLNFKTSDKPSA
jgi:predicted  nucleic acid-binding Zn-ribbon protein